MSFRTVSRTVITRAITSRLEHSDAIVPPGPYISAIMRVVTCVSGSVIASPFVSKSFTSAFTRFELA